MIKNISSGVVQPLYEYIRIVPGVCEYMNKLYVFGGANSPSPFPEFSNRVEAGAPVRE